MCKTREAHEGSSCFKEQLGGLRCCATGSAGVKKRGGQLLFRAHYTRTPHLQKATAPGPRMLSHLGLPSQSPPPSRLLAVGGASASRRGHQAAVFVEVDMMLTPSRQFRSQGGRERRHSSPRSASAPGKRCRLVGTSYQCGNRSRTHSTRRFAEPGCVSASGLCCAGVEEATDEQNLFCRNAFRTCSH